MRDFERVFLMLKYTDITPNTYVQICTVTEIMAREKCGLAGPRTASVQLKRYVCFAHVLQLGMQSTLSLTYERLVICTELQGCLSCFPTWSIVTHFVYGFCNGNARAVIEEYQRRFPNQTIPSGGVFTRIHQTMRETGCLSSFAVQSEREVLRTINT